MESEPELAWLLLVSAIEVAAVHCHVTDSTAIDILRQSKKDLAEKLDPASLELVADAFAELLRSTGRFIDFLCTFLPEPPDPRPPEGFQLQWSVSNMKKRFNKVYALRSSALHGGIPFPPPMCWPPSPDKGGDFLAPCETVPGLATSSTGGVWKKEDMPFSLHTFEYIARGALLGWWRSLFAG